MDAQDHKTTATSTGHEGHGVHLCRRCGWPFPNPHPSAKHRRAHKKNCGKIEGYKIIDSQVHDDHHLPLSDDEHAPDDDWHTPSPNLVKKNAESSGGLGEKSNKSEDDVFSDAVTDFSESGANPRLDRFESARDLDMSLEQIDRTEESSDPRSEETSNSEPLVNGNSYLENVTPMTDTSVEAVSVELTNGEMNSGHNADIHMHENELASVTLDSEEGKVLDHSIKALEREEEDVCHKPVSEAVTPQTETVENCSNSGVHNVLLEVADEDETQEIIDALVGVKETSHSVKPDEDSQTLDATKDSDTASTVICVDKEVEPEIIVAGTENADVIEIKEPFAVDTVPAPDSEDNSSALEHDQTTTAFKKDVDHCDEKSNGEVLETGNEEGERASVEVHEILDSTKPSDKETDVPSSLESRDNGFEKSIAGSELNHDIGDALDKNALPTASLEDCVSPVVSKLPNNIHVMENVVGVESVDVSETATELKDNDEVASEIAPEQWISKELLSKNSANRESESIDTAKLDEEDNVVLSRETSQSPTPQVQEASPTSKYLDVTSPGVEESHSVGIVSSTEIDGNVLASEKCLVTPSLEEKVPSPLDFQDIHKTHAPVADEITKKGEESNSLQAEVNDKLTVQKDSVSAVDISGSSSGRSDSLEGNCGSFVSDSLDTNSQKQKPMTEEACSDRSDTFEPPSFMTLVQSGGERDEVKAATEIETEQNNQQPKSNTLQAGWFPSLTNVVNESEGRKKNEEIITKVTNWSTGKQQHGPLKTLLNEVKSPNMKQVPPENQKLETDVNSGVATLGSVLGPEKPATKNQDTNKDAEEWNSPARYPIEIKKEKKKKGRSYWVPFVCCSSVHRDL